MNDITQTIVMGKNPFKSLRNLVEEKRSNPETKQELKVNIVMRFPITTQEFPIIGVYRHKVKV